MDRDFTLALSSLLRPLARCSPRNHTGICGIDSVNVFLDFIHPSIFFRYSEVGLPGQRGRKLISVTFWACDLCELEGRAGMKIDQWSRSFCFLPFGFLLTTMARCTNLGVDLLEVALLILGPFPLVCKPILGYLWTPIAGMVTLFIETLILLVHKHRQHYIRRTFYWSDVWLIFF